MTDGPAPSRNWVETGATVLLALAAVATAWSQVRRNVQRSTNYVLAVVLFAVALFFAGISTKLSSPGARKALLIAGWVVFAGAAAWIATSPVSVSV